MLSAEDNDLLTRTGADAPMGRFMREYWVPVLKSSELQPGCDPLPITVFGDQYVAYRTPAGEAGVMDEACPHRGASMRLARNEECGLRCIYHGWKISPSGALLEAPTHPPGAPLHKMRTGGRPVREQQGIVWTWLGTGEAPAFPKQGWMWLPEGHVLSGKMVLNCNWLHPLETLWDVFHAQILHNNTNRNSIRGKYYFSKKGSGTAGGLTYDFPEMENERTEYGFDHTNIDEVKISRHAFVYPYYQYHPTTPGPQDDRSVQISVPIDDDHTMLWFVMFNRHAPLKEDGLAMKVFSEIEDPAEMLKPFGKRTPENRWGQDREAMRSGGSFSGLRGAGTATTLMLEDAALIESQGRLNRSKEMLGPVDSALVEARQFLIDAVRAYERTGTPPARDLDLPTVESTFISRLEHYAST